MATTERTIRPGANWRSAGEYEDIRFETADGIAKITIDRPEVRNAFRPETLIEISDALERAREDTDVGVIVLTGEGPLAFCSGGDQRVRGDTGYVPDGEADRRDGGRLRHRRRARPARRLRPHDRGRQRPLRPDRPQGRELRRRLWRQPARRPGRPEEGQGDLVPVPPVRRAGGARDGPRQHGRPARAARGGDRRLVPRDARALPLRPAASQGELQRQRGRPGRPPAARPRRQPPLLRQRGGPGGARGLQGEAKPGLRQVSEAAVSGATGRGGKRP